MGHPKLLRGTSQQVGSNQPGWETQGEREPDSHKATLPPGGQPIPAQVGSVALKPLPHAVQRATAELRVVGNLLRAGSRSAGKVGKWGRKGGKCSLSQLQGPPLGKPREGIL